MAIDYKDFLNHVKGDTNKNLDEILPIYPNGTNFGSNLGKGLAAGQWKGYDDRKYTAYYDFLTHLDSRLCELKNYDKKDGKDRVISRWIKKEDYNAENTLILWGANVSNHMFVGKNVKGDGIAADIIKNDAKNVFGIITTPFRMFFPTQSGGAAVNCHQNLTDLLSKNNSFMKDIKTDINDYKDNGNQFYDFICLQDAADFKTDNLINAGKMLSYLEKQENGNNVILFNEKKYNKIASDGDNLCQVALFDVKENISGKETKYLYNRVVVFNVNNSGILTIPYQNMFKNKLQTTFNNITKDNRTIDKYRTKIIISGNLGKDLVDKIFPIVSGKPSGRSDGRGRGRGRGRGGRGRGRGDKGSIKKGGYYQIGGGSLELELKDEDDNPINFKINTYITKVKTGIHKNTDPIDYNKLTETHDIILSNDWSKDNLNDNKQLKYGTDQFKTISDHIPIHATFGFKQPVAAFYNTDLEIEKADQVRFESIFR